MSRTNDPWAGKTSYKFSDATQTNPETAGPQPNERELVPKPYVEVATNPWDFTLTYIKERSKETGAGLVGYKAKDLANALNVVCNARGCMHTADTTGVGTQSYMYFKPGKSKARHPNTGAEVWAPGLSHITIVRVPPKPYVILPSGTDGQPAPAANKPVPADVAALYGETLHSGDQGENGTHLTIRSEENVLAKPKDPITGVRPPSEKQDANQVSQTEGIPVEPEVVRQNHFARGRFIPPKGMQSKDFATGVSIEEATYRQRSYKFWTGFRDTCKQKRAKVEGESESDTQRKWDKFFEDLNEDFKWIMETWALVLEKANVITSS